MRYTLAIIFAALMLIGAMSASADKACVTTVPGWTVFDLDCGDQAKVARKPSRKPRPKAGNPCAVQDAAVAMCKAAKGMDCASLEQALKQCQDEATTWQRKWGGTPGVSTPPPQTNAAARPAARVNGKIEVRTGGSR